MELIQHQIKLPIMNPRNMYLPVIILMFNFLLEKKNSFKIKFILKIK
jgi:hypothetical protein